MRSLLGFVAGGVVGALLVAAVVVLLVLREQRVQYERGRICGLSDAADAFEKEFGSYDGTSTFTRVFNVKCADVLAIEMNGVKTPRVARPVCGASCGHP